MVRPNVQRGTMNTARSPIAQIGKLLDHLLSLIVRWFLYLLSKYLVNTKLHRATDAGNTALNKSGVPSPQPKIGTMSLYRLSRQGKLPCKRKYEEVILMEARNIVGSGR